MNISQVLTKLKALIYSKSETDSLLGGKANSSHTHTKSQITDFPIIPTKTSQLTNDSGFLTSHQSLSNYLTKTTNVSEMGRYIDMHYDNATAARDYDVRLYVDSQGSSNGAGSFKISSASVYTPNNLYLGSYRVYVG